MHVYASLPVSVMVRFVAVLCSLVYRLLVSFLVILLFVGGFLSSLAHAYLSVCLRVCTHTHLPKHLASFTLAPVICMHPA